MSIKSKMWGVAALGTLAAGVALLPVIPGVAAVVGLVGTTSLLAKGRDAKREAERRKGRGW